MMKTLETHGQAVCEILFREKGLHEKIVNVIIAENADIHVFTERAAFRHAGASVVLLIINLCEALELSVKEPVKRIHLLPFACRRILVDADIVVDKIVNLGLLFKVDMRIDDNRNDGISIRLYARCSEHRDGFHYPETGSANAENEYFICHNYLPILRNLYALVFRNGILQTRSAAMKYTPML